MASFSASLNKSLRLILSIILVRVRRVLRRVLLLVMVAVRVLLMVELLLLLCVQVLLATHMLPCIVQMMGVASSTGGGSSGGRVHPPVLPLFFIQEPFLALVLLVIVAVHILAKRAATKAPILLSLHLNRC